MTTHVCGQLGFVFRTLDHVSAHYHSSYFVLKEANCFSGNHISGLLYKQGHDAGILSLSCNNNYYTKENGQGIIFVQITFQVNVSDSLIVS